MTSHSANTGVAHTIRIKLYNAANITPESAAVDAE
jgi:hypothetical protein